MLAGTVLAGVMAAIGPWDADVSNFGRQPGETGDSARILRAVESAGPGGVVWIPRGEYAVDATLVVSNRVSLQLHKSACLKAVREMPFVLRYFGREMEDGGHTGREADHNLFIKGGIVDGNGLASCAAVMGVRHVTLADTTYRNGRKVGLQLGDPSLPDNVSRGYEIFANNLYFVCTLPGMAGNVGFLTYIGDSHFTDMVVVDYTIGIRDCRWSNRFTRCHVWGGPVRNPKTGRSEYLPDSIAFDLQGYDAVLDNCYADTAMIGFNVCTLARLLGCAYHNNWGRFRMDNPVAIMHRNEEELLVSNCRFDKESPHATLYRRSPEAGPLVWRDNLQQFFEPEDVLELEDALKAVRPGKKAPAERKALAESDAGAALTLVPAVREMTEGDGVYRIREPMPCAGDDWIDYDTTGACLSKANSVATRDASLPPEGYSLVVTSNRIAIAAADDAGEFYARTTLRQLTTRVSTDTVEIACCEIRDWPQYRWRGLLLDETRHFFGKEIVKRLIGLMAQHKLNVLHWHLTDDQGWRIDIPGRPELVKYGASRPRSVAFGTHARWLPPRQEIEFDYNTETYGPYYYTVDDVKEVLAFARLNHVRVVPEIELPGHVRAFLAAHPECSCCGKDLPREPRCGWSVEEDVLCVGNDESVRIFGEILDRVCEMFPDSPFIHIGGDECPRRRWKECPKCQARMKAEGLKDENGLQAWIVSRMVRHLEKKGRRAVGWDEVLAGDVPMSTVGMSWRTGAKGGAGNSYVSAGEAVTRGHDMVMAPREFCYLDRMQGIVDDPYPYYSPWPGDELTLEKAYSFDPVAGIPAEDRCHVIGGQACLWTESTFNVFDLDWKTWPRACATAEALWTAPVERDLAEFGMRLSRHRKRLVACHVNVAPVNPSEEGK